MGMLDRVKKGRLDAPLRVLLYGVEKIGKSTFASESPAPIFLCPEEGTSELDVARLPEPETWSDVLAAAQELLDKDHEYRTLVLDTLDWIAPLAHARVVDTAALDRRGKKPQTIDEVGGGFGKGYRAAVDQWRLLLDALTRLRAERGMHVIMLAHARIKRFSNPEGEDYDRFELKLSSDEGGLLKEWSDAVLFANYETSTVKDGPRVKGISDGARYVYTVRHAAYDAGNRYSLPERLPLDWSTFFERVEARRPATVDQLRAQIRSLVAGSPDLEDRAEKGIDVCGQDAEKLARLLNKVQATVE